MKISQRMTVNLQDLWVFTGSTGFNHLYCMCSTLTPKAAQTLPGKSSSSFAHLVLDSLSGCSWKILSSSVRLDVKCLWTAANFHRCSARFKSGPVKGSERLVPTPPPPSPPPQLQPGSVLQVVGPLKGELSPQSQVSYALELPLLNYHSVLSRSTGQSDCPSNWEPPPYCTIIGLV